MTSVPLPDDPKLEDLRREAEDLRDLAGAGVPAALDLVGAHHPDGPHPISLAGAQLVVARHYGFASWTALERHLEVVDRFRREPDRVDGPLSLADRFLDLACLRYADDDSPERRREAAGLLAEHPGIIRSSVGVAAATADRDALAALVQADPGLATRQAGPYRWEPLLYLAYARHDPAMTEEATLGTARLLLANGADPNAGFLWHGLTTPFTAVTGALGRGEGQQPEHPHGMALAELLLEAGADANDGQALYNRQFGDDDRHLVLLLGHGLGQGDGGPWRARLGHTTDSPYQLVRTQLWWALVHDLRDRVRLLVEHGVDFLSPYRVSGDRPSWARTSDGRTPAEVAALAGCPELVDWLGARGAHRPPGESVDGLVAAVLAGDRAGVERLRDHADAARRERPGLVVWAAARRKPEAVRLLVELGFDVNALGRADVPMEQSWETALHQAASAGDVDLARLLLDLGADPTVRDARFDSTPLGWARHFDEHAVIELLEPLTGQ